MKKPMIIIFGKDPILRFNLKKQLESNGCVVNEAPEKFDIIDLYNSIQPDVVIVCSYRKALQDKLSAIKKLRQVDKRIPIILINRFSSESRAIEALRAGASDYFKVPFSSESIIKKIFRLLSARKFEISSAKKSENTYPISGQLMVGESRCMQDVKDYLCKVAPTDSNVLITGETGTGKELAAGLIHSESPRYKNPFVCINSAALPETLIESELFGYDRGAFTGAVVEKPGKFEMANGGTVFLDEIGDMSHYAQAKVLRIIESRQFFHLGGKRPVSFDARIIAATNKEPAQLIEEGKLRDDLYYRLNVARIHLPPLRERKEDIPSLVSHVANKLNRRFDRNIKGLTDDALACLLRYDWPGNIRELFNLLEAIYISLPSGKLDFIDLPKPIQKQINAIEVRPADERKQIVTTLLQTNWNKSTAAEKLNWSRMTLYRKMTKYNIVEKRSRENLIH